MMTGTLVRITSGNIALSVVTWSLIEVLLVLGGPMPLALEFLGTVFTFLWLFATVPIAGLVLTQWRRLSAWCKVLNIILIATWAFGFWKLFLEITPDAGPPM